MPHRVPRRAAHGCDNRPTFLSSFSISIPMISSRAASAWPTSSTSANSVPSQHSPHFVHRISVSNGAMGGQCPIASCREREEALPRLERRRTATSFLSAYRQRGGGDPSVREVRSNPRIDLDIAGVDRDRAVPKLLWHVEGLRVTRPTFDEPHAEVQIRTCVEVVADGRPVQGAKVLANLVLAIGVVRNHDVGADAVVDVCNVGRHMRPEESGTAWSDLGSEIDAEVLLLGLLLDGQPGLGVLKRVSL